MQNRRMTLEMLHRYETVLVERERAPTTVKRYMHCLQDFYWEFKGKNVTKEAVIAYKNRLKEQYTASGVNVTLAAVNGFLSCQGWHDCKVQPLRIQRASYRKAKRALKEKEYRRLLEAARNNGDDRLYCLIETICATGIRVSELQYITVQTIQCGCAEVQNKGKIRTILLPLCLCSRLREYCRRHRIEQGSIFVTRGGRPLDRSNIWRMMKRLCAQANVPEGRVFPHNLRHLFARTFYLQYRDLDHLATLLGHSSVNTTRIYTRTEMEPCRAQLDRLHLLL